MKFFLDSASLEEIQEALDTGLIDGVTTNPSLVSQTGVTQAKLIGSICERVGGPVSAEVTSLTAAEMVEEGKALGDLASNVVVKVPLTLEGLKACRVLRHEGIAVNVTLCFSPIQALLAAKVEASYVSPFMGRLEDIGGDGKQLLADIRDIFHNGGYTKTQILAASIRNLEHVKAAALAGADVATLPFGVFKQLCRHPLTDTGLEAFMRDAAKTPKEPF